MSSWSSCVCVFFKQKTDYELRISDWSSDVGSSDLHGQVIFFCAASFQADEAAPEHQLSMPEVPRPEDIEPAPAIAADVLATQNGRASCRARVFQSVLISVGDVTLKTKRRKHVHQ